MKSAQQLMSEARYACMAVASGPHTPVVFEPYEHIGGERGVLIGYPSETQEGRGCIVWTSRPTDREDVARG
jgi:hypothetical protein